MEASAGAGAGAEEQEEPGGKGRRRKAREHGSSEGVSFIWAVRVAITRNGVNSKS